MLCLQTEQSRLVLRSLGSLRSIQSRKKLKVLGALTECLLDVGKAEIGKVMKESGWVMRKEARRCGKCWVD